MYMLQVDDDDDERRKFKTFEILINILKKNLNKVKREGHEENIHKKREREPFFINRFKK